MSATIAALLDMGWEPDGPSWWRRPGHDTAIDVGDKVTKQQIAEAVRYYMGPKSWSAAGQHGATSASELPQGADLAAA